MSHVCPQCSNPNESRMTRASGGKRIYCLECNNAFWPLKKTTEPKVALAIFEGSITRLEKRVTFIEKFMRVGGVQ